VAERCLRSTELLPCRKVALGDVRPVEVFAQAEGFPTDAPLPHAYPVMLVIGTFSEDDERTGRKERVDFDSAWRRFPSLLSSVRCLQII